MAQDKQVTDGASKANGLLAGLPPWAPWAIAIVAVLVVVAGFVWWYRKKRKQPAAAPAPATATTIGESTLADAWSAFLDKAPREASDYPVFVVLGDLDAGKSHLIDSRVAWKGQDARGRRSAFGLGEISFYLGPDVIVQEISTTVLHDYSEATTAALTALWKSLDGRAPKVVCVLDAPALALALPADVNELAQAMRGKINVLSSIHGNAAINVRVCLTKVDRLDQLDGAGAVDAVESSGFSALAAAVDAAGFDVHLPLIADRYGPGITGCLTPLDPYVSRALTSTSSSSFARVIRFFARMEPVLGKLSPFLEVLRGREAVSKTPTLGDLSLSAKAPSDHIGDPFAIDPQAASTNARDAELRTQRNCLVALGLAASLTGGFSGYHVYTIHKARVAVDAFVKSTRWTADSAAGDDRTRAERRAGQGLEEVSISAVPWPPLWVSFTDERRQLREDFTEALRTTYVLPALEGRPDRDQLVYALGLLYAARHNDLGALVRDHATHWAARLEIPDRVPEDYIVNSHQAWSGEIPTPTVATDGNDATTKEWGVYLGELETLFTSEEITPTQLETVQHRAISLGKQLEDARFYKIISATLEILSRDNRQEIKHLVASLPEQSQTPAWVTDNHDTLVSLLSLVRGSALSPVKVDGVISLQQLLDHVAPSRGPVAPAASATPSASAAGSAAAAGPAAPEDCRLTLEGKDYRLCPTSWASVLRRSGMGLLVEAFIATKRGKDGYAFFASDPPSYVAVGAAGTPGRGPTTVIRGVYSRDAVEGDVKPVLLGFEKQLEDAPLATKRKDALRSHVQSESARYALGYSNELRAYYGGYVYKPASAAALEYDLAELASPSSWLATFLNTVASQTNLDLKGTAPYLNGLTTKLEPFKPVAEIAGKLDKYTGVVSKMLPPPLPPSDKPPVLADLLSPEGKVALDILRNEKDNALAAVTPPLDSAGLTPDLRGPFLGPVTAAYNFGRDNLKQVIEQRWKQEILGPCAPVLARYPFNRAAEQEASISDLEACFTPIKGRFWDGFNRLIAPICDLREGSWYARPAPSGLDSPPLPAGLLKTVNGLAQMSARLWDKDGKPQPLSIGAQAQPLPPPQPGDAAVTLSQLHTGETSVFGFNQTPAPQTLDLLWWSQGTSSIDIQLLARDSGKKQYQTLPAPDSAWSFYRLLDRAASISKQLEVTWNVPIDDAGRTLKIRFVLTSDPWAPFRPPQAAP